MQRLLQMASLVSMMTVLVALTSVAAYAQNSGIGLNPGRLEVEMRAGQEKTVGFQIESAPSDHPVRGRLILTLTDWKINPDTSVAYTEPGTLPDSAAGWVVFSPSAISVTSGQTQLVRVTVKVPAGTAPGVYRTGIFVQERPPAALPEPGQNVVFFRFRYLFSLYVIVPPVSTQPEVTDIRVSPDRRGLRVTCEMKNAGTRHVRPYVTWILRDQMGNPLFSYKNQEATVLLPKSTIREPVLLRGVAPGQYEVEVLVDFRDGGPIQSLKSEIRVASTDQ